MAGYGTIRVRLVITNRKAIRALGDAIELAEELTECAPWSPEAKRLLRRLLYLKRHLDVTTEGEANVDDTGNLGSGE